MKFVARLLIAIFVSFLAWGLLQPIMAGEMAMGATSCASHCVASPVPLGDLTAPLVKFFEFLSPALVAVALTLLLGWVVSFINASQSRSSPSFNTLYARYLE